MHDGLDVANVTEWNGRPKRTRKPPPKTYWEEYVETDNWYLKKLVEDIPPEEMHAACLDEDLSDAGEEGDSELDAPEEDSDAEDIPSDDASDGSDATECSSGSVESAQVYRTPERK